MGFIVGTLGPDLLIGDPAEPGENDTLLAEDGDDTLYGGGGVDRLYGGADNDLLFGGPGQDSLSGGAGSDCFVIDPAADAPDDIDLILDFSAAEGDVIDLATLGIGEFASLQRLLIDRGSFTDLVVLRGGTLHGVSLAAVADPAALGPASFRFSAAATDDRRIGTTLADDLFGAAGDDSLYGLADADRLFGEAGNDALQCGEVGYLLFGGDGADEVAGDYGDDRLEAGEGGDTLCGDYGFASNTLDGNDSLYGGDGDDVLFGNGGQDLLDGGAGHDTLTGARGTDTLTGGTGADRFAIAFEAAAVESDDFDFVSDFSLADGDTIDLQSLGIGEFETVRALLVPAPGDAASSQLVFHRNGFSLGMHLTGVAAEALDATAVRLSGATDNDALTGTANADDLFGGFGDDSIDGAGGNDRLFGEAGNDALTGALEADSLFGGAGDDILIGHSNADLLIGGTGNDTLIGDEAETSYSNDSRDSLYGGAGDDVLQGGGDDDAIFGGAGNNTLEGGRGRDTLTGGDTDVFRIASVMAGLMLGDDTDLVTNFSLAQGDRIDLSRLGLSEFATVQQFLTDLGGDTRLSGKCNGADWGVVLQGISDPHLLGEAQFILETVASNDVIRGKALADDLFGGLGDDTITAYGTEADRLFGESGDDVLHGAGDLGETMFGGSGQDQLRGGYSGDRLYGGDGDDVIDGDYGDTAYAFDGNDLLQGGAGNDRLRGGGGTADRAVFTGDWADYRITASTALTITLADQRPGSPDGIDTISGVELFTFANGTFAAAQILNDAPLAVDTGNGADAVIEAGGTANAQAGDAGASGNLLALASDADAALGDALAINGARLGTEPAGGAFAPVSGWLSLAGTYGTLQVHPDGRYSYTLNNADPDTERLKAGQQASEVFTFRITDRQGLTDTAQLLITVTGSNDAPVITSNGGGETATVTMAENTTAVTILRATDSDTPAGLTYAIIGGADAALFRINAATGALTFLAARDFESPKDVGLDNVYELQVRVSDGALSDLQSIAVTVSDAAGVTVTGTAAADLISAYSTAPGQLRPTNEDDLLDGQGGNDTLTGLAGNDDILGGSGNDQIYGGTGTDTLNGDGGDDRLNGGSGTDFLDGGDGNDVLDGSLDNDVIQAGLGEDALLGGSGNDSLFGGAGNDTLDGGAGNDAMTGGDGDDTYRISSTADTVTEAETPGGGIDRVYAAIGLSLTDLSPGVEELILLGTANLAGRGNSLNNILIGNSGANSLGGLDGNDALYGGDGDDTLNGGNGADTLNGGNGRDSLMGFVGDDVLLGGADDDTLNGWLDNDSLIGGDGMDSLIGSNGVDTLNGGNGSDTLDGGVGNDTLIGGGDDDLLIGGSEADKLDGGTGNDTLTGGTGADTFVFAGSFGADVITDFNRLQAGEVIDISALPAITSFADLMATHVTQIGPDTVITIGLNSITLAGITATSLLADDFLI